MVELAKNDLISLNLEINLLWNLLKDEGLREHRDLYFSILDRTSLYEKPRTRLRNRRKRIE
ncbi:hypothetical protein Q3V94_02165 [Caloramator sp. CAR-1]|uniref:hypothetical protein n=1 Tax=Caloramator sp. CAR-1 TaxID=3062777 RepID=UPI0026E231D5|nr:hypothetical protein [Caloramator sp. CAR-1]MDO6353891.1 hypothetical protein [Caloramator sp. CAR-1]